ncbi:MAG: S46 family peptidase, partial [Holophaga sp.]|nr:S46 family peptidase [Holophaga sp.]
MSFSRAASVLTALLSLTGLHADEGMWTFDNLPLAKIQAKYGFAPDAKWLEHVRLASLNFGGASGSFISKDGLVVTNHHVGRGAVQSVSGPGAKDYIKLGFLAKTRAEEIKIPGLVIRTLMAMENVSDKVQAAVKPGMDAKAATEARQLAFEALRTDLEKRSTGLEVRAVTLYQGGEYWLYTSKAHRDVRLVMAPEMQAAMFGGDFDNFTYPR